LLNAILLNSIWIKNPVATLSDLDPENFCEDELESNARTIANAIKEHISKHKLQK